VAPGASGEERKQFFFEKKNQKTFTSLGPLYQERPKPTCKSFLLLFFKKEDLSFAAQLHPTVLPLPSHAVGAAKYNVARHTKM
jgi:hypothetical protein